jgi:hypothetical protein
VPDRPVRLDALLLQPRVGIDELGEAGVGVGDMVHTRVHLPSGALPRRVEYVQVRESEPVMLVVVRKERERRVLVLDFRFEHLLVPSDHFLEASRPINDVREFRRLGHGYPSMNIRNLRPCGAPGNAHRASR